MPKPATQKFYLLNRYFKFHGGEPLLHEIILSDPENAKGCIDDWKKYFHDFEDFTYSISVIEILNDGYITKNIYTYDQLIKDELIKLEENKLKETKKSLEVNQPPKNFELIALTAKGKELEKVLSRFFPNT